MVQNALAMGTGLRHFFVVSCFLRLVRVFEDFPTSGRSSRSTCLPFNADIYTPDLGVIFFARLAGRDPPRTCMIYAHVFSVGCGTFSVDEMK